MSYWRREEKAIERILRVLMKLPENRRCINCNHLGPRYVCTSFSTFVCTVCSGVHREFGHRVKSVSMAHFNHEEVLALQDGGNERAREIYLEGWDPERNTHPDGSDIDRIRDFIKHVYVDKRYTRERRPHTDAARKSGDGDNFHKRYSIEKPGLSLREEFYERRYHERSRPTGRSEKNYREYTDGRSKRNHIDDKDYWDHFEGSSPRSIYERFGGHRRHSSTRFEIVDNRIRDDRYERRQSESLKISSTDTHVSEEPQTRDDRYETRRSESLKISRTDTHVSEEPQTSDDRYETQRSESLKISNVDTSMSPEPQRREEKVEPMELEPQKIRKKPNPPVLRPLRDIMLQMNPTIKSSDHANAAASHQKTAFSEIHDSADVKENEKKEESESRLIDIKNNLESHDTSANTQTERGSTIQSSTEQKTSNPPSINSVEYLLLELSVGNASKNPITDTASSAAPNASSDAPNISSSSPVASLTEPVTSSNLPTSSPTELVGPPIAPVTVSDVAANNESASMSKTSPTLLDEIPVVSLSIGNAQTHPIIFADSVSRVAEEENVQTPQHQPSTSPAESNSSTAPGNASTDQSSQAVSKESQTTKSHENGSKSSGRKELPPELFTFSHPTYPSPMNNWQCHPPHGMGYGMQYAPSPNVAAFPSSAKSRNPFDVEDDPRTIQSAMLPLIASVPGALARMPPHAGMQPRPLPFASGMPPEYSPSYEMYMPPGGYMGQQLPNHSSTQRPQGTGSFGAASAFASFNPTLHIPGGFSSNPALETMNSFPSAGRNPFA
ncbi:hypothetical protein DCAR_0101444 [Daucus carota subsp. sativus]|uniref:Arf-GAP domain-containing protein n=1 Tax=Daucus carota subsp. sativus TaxID=79200 RepID=A0AAF0W3G9_DAUCS|nr:hypothetical protein DCAR_0101444 [Daucus carota subsp. sativus]